MNLFPHVCKYCVPPKRHMNCHSDCPDYLEAKADHEQRMRKIKKEQAAQRDAEAAAFHLTRDGWWRHG